MGLVISLYCCANEVPLYIVVQMRCRIWVLVISLYCCANEVPYMGFSYLFILLCK